jgi:hypothetical protein
MSNKVKYQIYSNPIFIVKLLMHFPTLKINHTKFNNNSVIHMRVIFVEAHLQGLFVISFNQNQNQMAVTAG